MKIYRQFVNSSKNLSFPSKYDPRLFVKLHFYNFVKSAANYKAIDPVKDQQINEKHVQRIPLKPYASKTDCPFTKQASSSTNKMYGSLINWLKAN